MGTESKGRAWFGKIYNKLETILVEVDTFTSQSSICLKSSDPSGWESVRGEPEEIAEDCSSGTSDFQNRVSCKSPFDPPSHQNFDVSGNVRVEERVQGGRLNGEIFSGAPLLQEYCNANLRSATTIGKEEPIVANEESQNNNTLTPLNFSVGGSLISPGGESVEEVRVESCRNVVSKVSQSTQCSVESFGTVVDRNDDPLGISTDDSNVSQIASKIPDASVQDNVANMRSSTEGNLDDVINGKSDVTPLDTKALCAMTFQEDPSFVDNNALYAVRVRTKKLRSFKRKIFDAITSKRRREEEYEQLAIWFGDANMGSDLGTGVDSKSSQVHELEDSQWELL